MGDKTCQVDINDLKRMEYCEAVIMESMRLFPPFPAVMRQVDYDFKLSEWLKYFPYLLILIQVLMCKDYIKLLI